MVKVDLKKHRLSNPPSFLIVNWYKKNPKGLVGRDLTHDVMFVTKDNFSVILSGVKKEDIKESYVEYIGVE